MTRLVRSAAGTYMLMEAASWKIKKSRVCGGDQWQGNGGTCPLTGTSAQKTELSALTRALELSQDRRLSICTDSKLVFMLDGLMGQYGKKEDF